MGQVESMTLCDYDTYFASGLYDARYPGPNLATLALIRRHLAEGRTRVLDFGCGSGRYTAPLLDHPATELIAYDICPTALGVLRKRLAPMEKAGRLHPVGNTLADLSALVDRTGPLDLALVLFGVLGHIRGRDERRSILERLRQLLRPDGKLILSVPNRIRRFRPEQRVAESRVATGELERGDIFYQRRTPDGTEIKMFYHLFTVAEIRDELASAGFAVDGLTSESILPEAAIVRDKSVATLDAALRAVTPLPLAYGFMTVATPASSV